MGPRRRNFVRPLGSPADAESSHFFNIILPETIRAQKMRIPKEFARRYENELSTGEATIGIPDGRIWRMELKKSEKEVCFCKGWREFVKYYSIKFGFILAFKYEGNSHFSLVIFDVSAAEIHYPLCKDNSEKQNLESKCPGKKSSFNHCSYNTRRKRHELEDQEEIIDIDCANDLSPGKLGNDKSYNSAENSRKQERNRSGPGRSSKMMKKTLSRKQRAIRAAQNFQPKKPSFTAIIKSPNLTARYMDVPGAFSKAHLEKVDSMKLQVSNGKRWGVNCIKQRSNVRMCGGWIDFARANNLKEGDVCVFELIKRNNFVFKVTIFAC